jgi:hypothetical protein
MNGPGGEKENKAQFDKDRQLGTSGVSGLYDLSIITWIIAESSDNVAE